MLKKSLMWVENRLIGRMWTQPIYEMLHRISVRGMNYMKGHTVEESGELAAMAYVDQQLKKLGRNQPVIFDVGANEGYYARCLAGQFGDRMQCYCFEPAAPSFEKLKNGIREVPAARPVQLGLGKANESVTLYYNIPGSTIASLYPLRDLQGQTDLVSEETIQIRRVEDYCQEVGIGQIDFLKVDVEGAELDVLEGCGEMLRNGSIRFIQFEYGPNNLSSKTCMKDFYRMLDHYQLFRVVQNGVRAMPAYHEILEIPLVSNFLAEFKG